ncbi:MAG: transposase [Methylohalobius sp.]
MAMKRCPSCGYTRAYKLSDGRSKCKRCGERYR